jgi:hypothetical protein
VTAMIELGPQYKRDDPFAARMRLYQSLVSRGHARR